MTRFQFRIGYSFIVGPKSAAADNVFASKLSKQLRRKIENKEKNYPYSKRFVSDTSLNMAKTVFRNKSDFSSEVILYIRFNINELYYFVVDKTNTIVDDTRVDLSDCTYTDESSERTLRLIEECVSSFSVTKVLIDSDDYSQIGGIKIILQHIAEEISSPISDRLKIIKVMNSDPSLAEVGAGIRLTDMFYDSIVKKLSE